MFQDYLSISLRLLLLPAIQIQTIIGCFLYELHQLLLLTILGRGSAPACFEKHL